MAYVYFLISLKDDKRYIGSTTDIERRLDQHNKGYVHATKARRPFKLFAYQYFETIQEASMFEKKYKRSHDLINRRIKSGVIIVVNNGV